MGKAGPEQSPGPGPEPAAEQPCDAELVRRAARGDERAFHGLIDRHGRSLFRLAVLLCGSAADAEDVLQETYAGAFRSLGRFEGRSSVKTWLTRILVTQVAVWRRKRQAKGQRAARTLSLHDPSAAREVEEHGPAPSTWSNSPAVSNPQADAAWRVDLQEALGKLSPEHRQVVVLRELEGLSYDEIAEVLGVPRGTVESRLHRARAELREYLRAYR